MSDLGSSLHGFKASGVDVQPGQLGSSPHGHKFEFLLFKKNSLWGFPYSFL